MKPPPDHSKSSEEAIKADLNVRLEEFRALRAEILLTLTSSYQMLTVGITGAGVVIGVASTVASSGKPIWLGLAPLLFYALLWTQLRYEYAVFNMSNHIIEKVAPLIRMRLKQLGQANDAESCRALSWESAGRLPTFPPEPWLVALEAARFAVPLMFAALTFCAYLLAIYTSKAYEFDFRIDISLSILNAFLFLFSVYAGIRLRSLLKQHHDAHERVAIPRIAP